MLRWFFTGREERITRTHTMFQHLLEQALTTIKYNASTWSERAVVVNYTLRAKKGYRPKTADDGAVIEITTVVGHYEYNGYTAPFEADISTRSVGTKPRRTLVHYNADQHIDVPGTGRYLARWEDSGMCLVQWKDARVPHVWHSSADWLRLDQLPLSEPIQQRLHAIRVRVLGHLKGYSFQQLAEQTGDSGTAVKVRACLATFGYNMPDK